MFFGHVTPLTTGPVLGPGLSSKTLFFKWPQWQSWKVPLDAVNNQTDSRIYYNYLNPVSVFAEALFICETKFCEGGRNSAPCFSLFLQDPWNRTGQWMVLRKCLINCLFVCLFLPIFQRWGTTRDAGIWSWTSGHGNHIVMLSSETEHWGGGEGHWFGM